MDFSEHRPCRQRQAAQAIPAGDTAPIQMELCPWTQSLVEPPKASRDAGRIHGKHELACSWRHSVHEDTLSNGTRINGFDRRAHAVAKHHLALAPSEHLHRRKINDVDRAIADLESGDLCELTRPLARRTEAQYETTSAIEDQYLLVRGVENVDTAMAVDSDILDTPEHVLSGSLQHSDSCGWSRVGDGPSERYASVHALTNPRRRTYRHRVVQVLRKWMCGPSLRRPLCRATLTASKQTNRTHQQRTPPREEFRVPTGAAGCRHEQNLCCPYWCRRARP